VKSRSPSGAAHARRGAVPGRRAFANLDQALREKYRVNPDLLKQYAITTVYVTHDHNEGDDSGRPHLVPAF